VQAAIGEGAMIPGLVSTKAFWAPQVAALADIANISVADHTRQANMWVSPAIRAKRRAVRIDLSMGGILPTRSPPGAPG